MEKESTVYWGMDSLEKTSARIGKGGIALMNLGHKRP
jgi:hypothetical protein